MYSHLQKLPHCTLKQACSSFFLFFYIYKLQLEDPKDQSLPSKFPLQYLENTLVRCPCRCRIAVAGVEVILYVNFHCENMLMHLWSRHGYDYIEFLYKGVKGFEDKKMVNGFNLTMTIQFHRWRKTSQSSRVEVIGTWHTFACIKLKEFIFKFNGKPKLKYFYTVDQ
ncbi:uncharacterized protein LOC131258230 isoform X6 [Magnolia sinica]|uniref:uncharacterized protein LOC131258230 isoform X6 n=1 Tax=Magnolia sinica TaxID=86752 RepID=UPI00265AD7D2|nr:uncharacterized protein LOC131258230 isoform X6 [Magnolia sinica]XP_058115385.1 uncharacterized protein LOC131258230 isoform X6 [Magnolia sinica]